MYHYCKLCGNCLLLDRLVTTGFSTLGPDIKIFKCHSCPEYSIWLRCSDNSVRVEHIFIKNFMLAYEPDSGHYPDGADNKEHFLPGRISIILLNKNDNECLHQFYGKELTHELAVQWVNKFSNLTVFQ